MDRARVDSREASAAGWNGVREEAQLPVHAGNYAPRATEEPVRAKRSWLGFSVRIVRDAAIAVALMALVPITIVAVNGDGIWRSPIGRNTRSKIERMEPLRPFSVPTDPTITPMRAGLAFNALQPKLENGNFPSPQLPSRPEATWRNAPLTDDMFPTARQGSYNGPASGKILEAVAHGFSIQEMEFLRTLATAPVWREFDLIARAPAVDFIGGQFVIPFAPGATMNQMPTPRFAATKEMAYAAVSRAAYHMAIGQRDSAETILRSIVSFGFAEIDNGATLLEQLIGTVNVGIGRDALQRYYLITGDPRAGTAPLAPTLYEAANPPNFFDPLAHASSRAELRQELIAKSANPVLHRAERYESLYLLSASSCTNVRELLFGTRTDVTDAFRAARRDLARYPSERAMVDLIDRSGASPSPYLLNGTGPVEKLVISTATIAGAVLGNPRLAACTRIILARTFSP